MENKQAQIERKRSGLKMKWQKYMRLDSNIQWKSLNNTYLNIIESQIFWLQIK